MARKVRDYEEAKLVIKKTLLSDRFLKDKIKNQVKLTGISAAALSILGVALDATLANPFVLPLVPIPIAAIALSCVLDTGLYFKYRKQIKNGTYFDGVSNEDNIRQANRYLDAAGDIIDSESDEIVKHY